MKVTCLKIVDFLHTYASFKIMTNNLYTQIQNIIKVQGVISIQMTIYSENQNKAFDLLVKVRFSQKVVICSSYRHTDEPFFVPQFQI